MRRLLWTVAVTGLLGAGLAAQGARRPAGSTKTAAQAKPVAPANGGWTARDWPTVANDPVGMKHSPLTQITPANVGQLTQAWTYDTGGPASGYTITPIVI